MIEHRYVRRLDLYCTVFELRWAEYDLDAGLIFDRHRCIVHQIRSLVRNIPDLKSPARGPCGLMQVRLADLEPKSDMMIDIMHNADQAFWKVYSICVDPSILTIAGDF